MNKTLNNNPLLDGLEQIQGIIWDAEGDYDPGQVLIDISEVVAKAIRQYKKLNSEQTAQVSDTTKAD
jgi:hypothetical protein